MNTIHLYTMSQIVDSFTIPPHKKRKDPGESRDSFVSGDFVGDGYFCDERFRRPARQ